MTTPIRPYIAAAGLLLAFLPQPLRAQDAGAEALATVHEFFDAMRAKDGATLERLFHAEARVQNAGQNQEGVPTVGTTPAAQFLSGVLGSEAYLDEQLWDEEVRVSGNLATVWTQYGFWVDQEFSHCGVDAFQLARTADGWQIIQVTDTRQREGCEIPEGVGPGGG